MVEALCKDFKIAHHNSSPYRSKMNGVVEVANENIKKIIQKMVMTYKDWHEMLPFALHGYRTTIRTSTGETPFSLVYGMEVVLPVEVEIPSLSVLMEAKLTEGEWMKKAFDKKVRLRVFREGDLVLNKILYLKPDSRGKCTPNYEGPYVVKRAFSGGALILTTMDGEEFTRPVNANAVKKYFS
ncbi:hypothetical protein KIW84_022570 [Lathyrus oleraceus]|uniref:Integrase catalytic domain-containing protein n=1 Tax=Pisum sativum TaxID=3888 RepID=A0A9D5BAX0_PEA|nr:hypothetical protein KIW84_022570 [Pisum sativum]